MTGVSSSEFSGAAEPAASRPTEAQHGYPAVSIEAAQLDQIEAAPYGYRAEQVTRMLLSGYFDKFKDPDERKAHLVGLMLGEIDLPDEARGQQ